MLTAPHTPTIAVTVVVLTLHCNKEPVILTSLYTVDTAIEVGISNFPVATNGTSAEDEPLLKDMMNFCLEGGTSTIDLAGAKARFADADIASLERSAIKLASSLCSVRQTGTCCQPPRFSEHGKRVLIRRWHGAVQVL